MRLAIADPPYPPNLLAAGHGLNVRASRWYSTAAGTRRPYGAAAPAAADDHPDAAAWDDPATHRALLARLLDEFDGWAIASSWDGPHTVYAPLPVGARVLVWHKPNGTPSGHRIQSRYETVIVYPPTSRRGAAAGLTVPDVLSLAAPAVGFAGAKPFGWTRWVLDALGYDQHTDVVVDVFPGSGAVARAAAQLTLDL